RGRRAVGRRDAVVRLVDLAGDGAVLRAELLPHLREALGEDLLGPLPVEDLVGRVLLPFGEEGGRFELLDVERGEGTAAAALQPRRVPAHGREKVREDRLEEGAEAALIAVVLREHAAFEEIPEEFLREVLRVFDRGAAGGPHILVDGAPVEGDELVERGFAGGRQRAFGAEERRPDRLREIFPVAPQRRLEVRHRFASYYAPPAGSCHLPVTFSPERAHR